LTLDIQDFGVYCGALVPRILQFALLATLICPMIHSQDSPGAPTKIERTLADLDNELRRIEALIKDLAPLMKSSDAASSVERAEAALNLLTAQEAYQRGRMAEENRQYEAAIDAFVTAIQMDPANDSALLHRGHAYLEVGKLDLALSDLNRSLAVQPNSSRAYELRAGVHRALKEYDQALTDLQAAARLDPNNGAYVLLQAAIAEEHGDVQTAIRLYSQALANNPFSMDIRLKRAAAFSKGKSLEEALKDCTGAIELQPSNAAGYLCRAEMNLRQSRLQPAIGDLDQAMRLNPLAVEAGPVISALWREIQLREVTQQASTLSDPSAKQRLAETPRGASDPVPAASLAPERPAAVVTAAPVVAAAPVRPVSQQTAPEAAPPAADTTQPQGTEAASYIKKGRSQIAENRYREAITELGKAIELDPNCAEAYNSRGYAYLREHEYGRAIADFTSAIRLNVKYANAYLNRGVARKLAGDPQGAKGDLQMARTLTAEAQASPKAAKAEQAETSVVN
jgi:tetratricopeptide (TPR) repeat protein